MAKRTQKGKKELVLTLRMAMWGGIALLGMSLVIGAMRRKENAPVKDILIEVAPLPNGHYLIDSSDVSRILQERFAPPLNMFTIGKVDVERLERVLEEDPFVLAAEAFIDAQDRINIHITQRQPVLRVMDNNDLNYYLDAQGNKIPPSKHYAARVVVVTGNVPPWEEGFLENDKHLLAHIFELSHILREDPFLNALIEQIYVTKKGELVLSPKVGKQIIYFGRYQEAHDKLKRLKVFYREGLPYKGWDAYKSFDLRYKGQVVCTKR
ncbi:MAG: cell division protein FtsQ [Bacteroidetes bacterium]|nr:MAG: cell division protein FtsQ [Bacteroidota bacterium]